MCVSGATPAALLSPGCGVGISAELKLLLTEDFTGARCWAEAASDYKISCSVTSVVCGVCGVQAGWVCFPPLMGYLRPCYMGYLKPSFMGYLKPSFMSYLKPCYMLYSFVKL